MKIDQPCCIGSYSHVSPFSFLAGGVRVGDDVTIHTAARIAPHKMIGDGATVGLASVGISNVKVS